MAARAGRTSFYKGKMNMKNVRLISIVAGIAFLLLIPWAAGFPWSRFDFITAGIVLLVSGLACEIVLRTVKSFRNRVAICIGILFLLFIIWAELAVGLIGTPLAGS